MNLTLDYPVITRENRCWILEGLCEACAVALKRKDLECKFGKNCNCFTEPNSVLQVVFAADIEKDAKKCKEVGSSDGTYVKGKKVKNRGAR